MSAKTGDNVSPCFYRVAAELAGVVLTKPEMEVTSNIVKAHVVLHPEDTAESESNEPTSRKRRSGTCSLQ